MLEDALRLLILYAEKQMTIRASKSDYCPKDDTAAIEATRTVKVGGYHVFNNFELLREIFIVS